VPRIKKTKDGLKRVWNGVAKYDWVLKSILSNIPSIQVSPSQEVFPVIQRLKPGRKQHEENILITI